MATLDDFRGAWNRSWIKMKLLTLNLWGGQVYEQLIDFLQKQASNIDIFCFQEILFGSRSKFTPLHKARVNLFSEIEKCLPDFTAFTYPSPQKADYFQSEELPNDTRAGQAIFVRKSLTVANSGGFRTYKTLPSDTVYGGKITGSCQWVEIQVTGKNIVILNLHGIWQKDTNKVDTRERLAQSEVISHFLSSETSKKVLCGDFNLRPDGKSMKKLEENMVNLVKEFGITSTRSELYKKPEKFADYVLISPEIKVENFQVLSDVVSDHLPLKLQFS